MPNGLLIVDKQGGLSSHDVVRLARKALRTRAVGHAGTLDPMATGVLVLGLGTATRLLRFLALDDKRYCATLKLGVGTDSLDADGQPIAQGPVPPALTDAHVKAAAQRFVGELEQQVPVVSAVKQAGEALYKKWRKGEQVEAPTRSVRVDALSIERVEGDEIGFSVACSKGFYVRALGRDLAAALGTVGHLTALRRTHSGAFGLAGAIPMAALTAAKDSHDGACGLTTSILSLEQSVAGMPSLHVTRLGEADLRHGRPMPLSGLTLVTEMSPAGADTPLAAFSETGELVAIVQRIDDQIRVVRGFPPRDSAGQPAERPQADT